MKNIFKYFTTGVILSLLLMTVGCTKLEEFVSTPAADAVDLSLQLYVVNQDSISVIATNADDGYLTVGLVDTSKLKDYDSQLFFEGKYPTTEVKEFKTIKVEKNVPDTIMFSGLGTNSAWAIVAVASNVDGKLGTMQQVSTTTTDLTAPELLDADPTFGTATVLAKNCEFTLVFSEPVVVDTSKGLELYFYYDDVTVPASDLNISEDGKYVTISSNVLARNREYVFLSFGEGAFKDLSGNPIAAQSSGIVDGYLEGFYWRVVATTFAPTLIEPADGDSVVAAEFTQIKLVYSEAVGGLHANYLSGAIDPVTITYLDANGDQLIKVVPNASITKSADTAFIALPIVPVAGQTLTLNMNASTLKVGITNPTAAVTATWNIK